MERYISKIEAQRVSIAPMVDRTDKHFRYFCRLITKKAMLYTEMITTHAIINGDRSKLLDFNSFEKPVALQIAGCNPKDIYEAVRIAEDWDYDEINLNAGCPSDRVAGNEMGAVLMAYPQLVAEMVSEMRRATKKPITVKHRIGIEGRNVLPQTFQRTLLDRYEDMVNFINIVEKEKVDRFIVHARIAVLEGLSPKENRDVPPLRYQEVYRLKEEFPYLNIEINGGVKDAKSIEEHLKKVDGVMVGRAAYENPFFLAEVDKFFKDGKVNSISRREVIEALIPYVAECESKGESGHLILRHTQGLFYDEKGSKQWKQLISPPWKNDISAKEVLSNALKILPQDVLDKSVTD